MKFTGLKSGLVYFGKCLSWNNCFSTCDEFLDKKHPQGSISKAQITICRYFYDTKLLEIAYL